LNNEIPSFWYLAEVIFNHEGKEHYITGGTLSMSPFHNIFKTPYISMGCTTQYADNSDFYEEQIDVENKKYFFNGKWVDLQQREELIRVKGEENPRV
jgi:acyl-homoserine lactone acylase PvdQ